MDKIYEIDRLNAERAKETSIPQKIVVVDYSEKELTIEW
jgi:hypothetical protein